jgi:Carboxypeptidase regulatory-like domain
MTGIRIASALLVFACSSMLVSSAALAAPAGSISGTVVVASGGAPLEGIEVCAFKQGEAFVRTCAITDSAGAYTISGLAPESYVVEFNGNELSYATQYYDGKPRYREAEGVVVESEATTPGIDAELFEGGEIEGTVTVGGQPANGSLVCTIGAIQQESERCTTSDGFGKYTISLLAPGQYKVLFYTPFSGPTYLNQYYSDKYSWQEAEPVSVAAGAATPDIDAELQRGAQIEGEVTAAATGAPLSGIGVCAIDANSKELKSCAPTGNGGEYALPPLLPSGTYKVVFSYERSEFFSGEAPEEDGYLTQYFDGAPTFATANPVVLTASEIRSGVNARLISTAADPTATSSSLPPPPPLVHAAAPRLRHCKKGHRRKREKGKLRCVRVAGKHRRHRRSHH